MLPKDPWPISKGSALIAALILVAVAGIMGSTILFSTSTDLHISGNFRRAVQTFYAAEAGVGEAQQRLRGSTTSNSVYSGDPSIPYQSDWTAYVLADSNWTSESDPTYSTSMENYIPIASNFTNTDIQVNSVQSEIPYWVKIHHKTEYDAEQAGHRTTSQHYLDADGSVALHSATNQGELIWYGYPNPSAVRPEAFTSGIPTLYSPIEVITSYGQVEGAQAVIQVEVAHPPGPPLWGAVYVGTEIVFSGLAITMDGMDDCGLLATGRPPISLSPSGSVTGVAGMTGNPPNPQVSPATLNLNQQIDDLNRNATRVTADPIGVSLGSLSSPAIVYAKPLGGTLHISQVTGFGIFLAKGDVHINPPFHWEGLMIVSGKVLFLGGLGSSSLHGALLAEGVQILNDNVDIALNSCFIRESLLSLSVQTLAWRQLL